MINMPKNFDMGGGALVDIEYLMMAFGVKKQTALKTLRVLHIKPVFIGDNILFSLVTFQRILHVLFRPGGPGFMFPGSKAMRRPYMKEGTLTEITDELLAQAEDPRILAEMAASAGTDKMLLRKFLDDK